MKSNTLPLIAHVAPTLLVRRDATSDAATPSVLLAEARQRHRVEEAGLQRHAPVHDGTLSEHSDAAASSTLHLDKQTFVGIDRAAMSNGAQSVPPLHQRQVMEFPYKHSTGPVVGRFLAGLKEQKKIWGQRVAGQGVVVPPTGYSEIDGSAGGEWVEVQDTGVVTAVAVVVIALGGFVSFKGYME